MIARTTKATSRINRIVSGLAMSQLADDASHWLPVSSRTDSHQLSPVAHFDTSTDNWPSGSRSVTGPTITASRQAPTSARCDGNRPRRRWTWAGQPSFPACAEGHFGNRTTTVAGHVAQHTCVQGVMCDLLSLPDPVEVVACPTDIRLRSAPPVGRRRGRPCVRKPLRRM
jgi:hypothetical protein